MKTTVSIEARDLDPKIAAAFARTRRPLDVAGAILNQRDPDHFATITATRDAFHAATDARRAFARSVIEHVARVRPRMLATPTGWRDEVYAQPMLRLAHLHDRAIRSVDDWTPRTHNAARMYRDLVRHLFQQHDVPPFVVTTTVFDQRHESMRALLPHIGQGGSFRTAKLPITMTRAVAHELSRMKFVTEPFAALRLAQCFALDIGGDVADEFVETTRVLPFGSAQLEPHLHMFLEWVRRNPIAAADVSTVLRFVADRLTASGAFSFAGRTARSLVRDANEAQRTTRKHEAALKARALPKSGIEGGRYALLDELRRVHHESRVWELEEIVEGPRLYLESKRMRHCVAGMVQEALDGETAFFSVTLYEWGKARRALTLSVNRAERKVTELRGFANRRPSIEEVAVIGAWARDRDLKLESGISGA